MKTDAQLRHDVIAEVRSDPSVEAGALEIDVSDSVVTLGGHVGTLSEKYAVERAVLRVMDVREVVMEFYVKLRPDHKCNDCEITAAAESVLMSDALVPADRIQVKVNWGWVSLRGEVDAQYQRVHAEEAMRGLRGVVGLRNDITVRERTSAGKDLGRQLDALA